MAEYPTPAEIADAAAHIDTILAGIRAREAAVVSASVEPAPDGTP